MTKTQTNLDEWRAQRASQADPNGNISHTDGVDRCYCGCKYWERDRCVDCGGTEVMDDDEYPS